MAWWKRFRKKPLDYKPQEDPTTLGRILVDNNWVTQEQLEWALSNIGHFKLGELLMSKSLITQEQLDIALTKQAYERHNMSVSTTIQKVMEVQSNLQAKATQSLREATEAAKDLSETGKISPIKRS